MSDDKYEHIDGPYEDGDYEYTGTVADYEPPATDPRPDPRTHPEYWTE